MKQQLYYLFSFLLLFSSTAGLAQFKGGSSDGHSMAMAVNQLLGRTIFRGGDNDGHSMEQAFNQPIGRNIFRGGTDDGHALALGPNQPLGRNIFRGGDNDGHSMAAVTSQALGRNIFLGGADDGQAAATATIQALGRNIFLGGSNDGWAMASGSGSLAVPLPVNLLNFSGRWQQNHGLLLWQTATETGSAVFEIQRSYDGSNFTTIGSVAAAGQSNALRQYQYFDSNQKALLPPGMSLVYYRLRTVDQDGKTDYSGIAILRADRDAITHYALYPNPARDFITISTDAPVTAGTSITLSDATGRVVHQEQMTTNRQQVSVSALPAGTYFLRLSDSRSVLYTQKLIITK